MVRLLLMPFVSVVADPSKALLGTTRFSVEIAPECSGLEGVALIHAFGLLWLVLFRRECRFPQALLLLPAGVAVIFLLNSVRIAALILIGNAGAAGIALGGFHSQAGWIIFNLVALGFSFAAIRIPWIRATSPAVAQLDLSENPTTIWLLPWLTLLAAGLLSHAMTADFEWLYPASVDQPRRSSCCSSGRSMPQRFDWHIDRTAPCTGVLVFFIWTRPCDFACSRPQRNHARRAGLSLRAPA